MISTHKIYRIIASAWSLFRVNGKPEPGFRLLMYHAVGTTVPNDIMHLYNISDRQFEAHIAELSRLNDGQIISLVENDTKLNKLCIGVSFDDGYRDNLYTAAPILEKYKVPFSIYIITNEVKSMNPLFLTPADVKRLDKEYGAVIGSHSASHVRLAECDDVSLKNELLSSKHYLEDLLGKEVNRISYPHGSISRRVRDMAYEVGYRYGATSQFDINRSGRDSLLLCRTDVWSKDDLKTFRQKIHGDWDWMRFRTKDPAGLSR